MNLVMAEFGTGGVDPTFSSLQQFIFGSVKLTLYNERNTPDTPFDVKHERWGNRMNDYMKVKGLVESKDIAVAMDADMKVVSPDFASIVALADKFGLCLPANPRHLVAVDGSIGADSNYDMAEDGSHGNAHAYNMSPIAYDPKCAGAAAVLRRYLIEMTENPCRGPLAMWRAVWKVGFAPLLLPVNWCVCRESVGCGNEIALHWGHKEVREFYG